MLLFIITLNFILNLSLFVQLSYQHRRYVSVSDRMNWVEAQTYCRKHHNDLATFNNKYEIGAIKDMCNFHFRCWIGLQRNEDHYDVWHWSGDETTFRNWNVELNESNNLGNKNCVALGATNWFAMPCDEKKAIMCYDEINLIVVNKTWEEALEHCRGLDVEPTSNAQTEQVWMGLLFMAGHWLWINGIPLQGCTVEQC
uniref:C-type lectin domain-containing protein n=1 Tax=Lates calcarifer TaxID=8187 RepID=A0A4W6FYI6_LATCA